MPSQYIYFNPNPILDPLVNNWELIRDEYFKWLPTHIGSAGVNNMSSPGTKPVLTNGDQPVVGPSYEGPVIKSDSEDLAGDIIKSGKRVGGVVFPVAFSGDSPTNWTIFA